MNPSIAGNRRVRSAGLVLLALVLVVAGLTAAARSEAAPVSLTFDNGQANIGIFNDTVILPAGDSFPSPDLPLPQRTDIQLNGDLNGSEITVPAATNTGIQFPYMHIMHPIEEGLKIPFTFRLNAPGLTGTWDESTGNMSLAGNLDVIVVTGQGTSFPLPDSLDDLAVPPLGLFARCRFDDVPVSFSTENKSPTTGQPFTGGFGVNGALTTSWTSLTPAVSETGGDCEMLNQIATSNGGLWLSNGVVDPIPQPEPPPPSCETDPWYCPPKPVALVEEIQIKPTRKVVRPGTKVKLTIRARNYGDAPARNLKVKIRTNKKKAIAPKAVTMTVPARKWAQKRITVRIKRKAKGRVAVVAAVKGWSSRANLVIKPKQRSQRRR